MDNCPTCERRFNGFMDYPVIHIVSFKKLDIKFPSGEGTHKELDVIT